VIHQPPYAPTVSISSTNRASGVAGSLIARPAGMQKRTAGKLLL
jgi:hypothetical protein